MNNNYVFVPDANIFIEAARRYYAFDIAPPFWDALSVHITGQSIIIVDRIFGEIQKGTDVPFIDTFNMLRRLRIRI